MIILDTGYYFKLSSKEKEKLLKVAKRRRTHGAKLLREAIAKMR